MSSVGEILQRERLERKVTLKDVAEATKISINFLSAIESNEFKKLPRGIFPKLFIRSYARFLELDEDQLVHLYYEQLSTAEATVPESLLLPVTDSGPQPDRRLWLLIFLAVILVTAVATLVYFLLISPAGQPASIPAPTSTPAPATTPATLPAPSASQSESPPSTPATESSTPPPEAATVPSTGPGQPQSPVESAAELEIRLKARERCWVNLDAGNGPVRDFILQPGDTYRQSFTGRITLIVGNAGGVDLFLNGQPTRQLGSPGEVITLHLSPEDYSQYLLSSGGQR